jgi:aspartyl-tRNA(Asn)/glutamyl-tRNA(Gln) amidotransferase subunit C
MKINAELVDKLAHLARLEFDDQQKTKIEADLNRILGFVESLNELDTSSVEPLIYLSEERNVLRADEQQQDISHEEALKNAPKKDSDYFRVPKVIGGN